MYYVCIRNNKIAEKGECICVDTECIEVTKEVYDNIEQYIYSDGEIILNPEWDNIQLDKRKTERVAENDELRDNALSGGVTYQNILFDSDTDQKINLLATVGMMSDTDTITWFGMDNQGLLCTKADLMAIGSLITELHSFCWQNNAYIKEQINQAESIEEVENIIIDYSMPSEK